MIKIYNRKSGKYEIEKVAGHGALKVLYENPAGKLGLELLIKRKFYSYITGVFCDTKFSSSKIKSFIEDYDIDMSVCSDKLGDFKSFNEFFTRRLTKEGRPFPSQVKSFSSPGDGRLRVWEDIDMNKLIQVKGMTYSLKELLEDEKLALKYQGGICVLLRLAPVDYHRFHFIDNGVCSESKKIRGYYYSVNPVALNSIPQVFCRNKREYSTFSTENFGDVLYMEVGATSVGSIVQTYNPGKPIARGDEKGYFKFGGSTVILFIEKNKVRIDNDIIDQTESGYETRVLAGEIIGTKI